MKVLKFLLPILCIGILSCNNDDDDKGSSPKPRDVQEVYEEDLATIEAYLATHSFRIENSNDTGNYNQIVFDTIAGDNANGTPIKESDFLKSKMVESGKYSFKLYYLSFREGAESEYKPTIGDDAVISYKGQLTNGTAFDQLQSPSRVDLPGFIVGFRQALIEFSGATGYQIENDGRISFNDDYGVGAVFVPSVLGYFNSTSATIPAYAPLIFSFQMYKAYQMDHDNDGIPSYLEDINGNGILLKDYEDDTDKNGYLNYQDADDDGDGTPTKDEIVVEDTNGNGIIEPEEISMPDTNGNGTPDYLDPTVF
ncbi:hypothetical protein GGR32_002090 [Mesonia hippocampi]|uniref:peptidylprolyl isomerase n=1 Tax=Mesonia hippocampi TaxID=1628250 RepID=A0A840F0I8_9FLAO|nr:hypothetical protein [Mesonia hippocampi]MBB4119784.1 hypothetical protein [Mesonia hippocampi]